jgi:hypothetical protein
MDECNDQLLEKIRMNVATACFKECSTMSGGTEEDHTEPLTIACL